MENNKAIKSFAYVVEYNGERLAEATVFMREWTDVVDDIKHYYIDIDTEFDGATVAMYTRDRLTFSNDDFNMFITLCKELRSNALLDRLYKDTNHQRMCSDLTTAESWFEKACSMAFVGTQTYSLVLRGLTYRSI